MGGWSESPTNKQKNTPAKLEGVPIKFVGVMYGATSNRPRTYGRTDGQSNSALVTVVTKVKI